MKVVAVVRDLFFVARIRETARLVGTPLAFARAPEELAAAPDVPVLGFTTHALARATQPLHARCRRVVTKETLTQELPALLQHGLAA
jgi:hypothetical protein